MRNDFQAIAMKKLIIITDTNIHLDTSQHWKLVPTNMVFFHGLVILLPQLSFLTPQCSPTWSSQWSHPLLFVVWIFAPASRGEKEIGVRNGSRAPYSVQLAFPRFASNEEMPWNPICPHNQNGKTRNPSV